MTIVPLTLVLGLAVYGVLEARSHARSLRQIPIRVHVNGTRGKSSVTRLIAAGLRAGRIRTFAKTTGTTARMIDVDGSEFDVYRVGRPNIIEQTRIVRRATEQGANALVIECMAVAPDLQPVTELRLIRSTVGVITNVRADHLDVLGPTVRDAAAALAQTIPVAGHAFTVEGEWVPILEEQCRRRGSELHRVGGGAIMEADLDGFSYVEHADNVALALAVCAHLGVDRETALDGMKHARPDPGVLRRYSIDVGAKRIEFVNAFAANDPDSTRMIWTRLGLDLPAEGVRRIALANCRSDRIHRSGQIAELIAGGLPADRVVLTGDGTHLVAQRALSLGLDPQRLTDLGGLGAEQVFERVIGLAGDRAIVVGIGNIVGLGQEIVLHFKNRAVSHG